MTESSQSSMEALTATLRNIVGPDNVIVDLNERIYFSQDYYKKVDPVALVIRPTSVEALALAVKHLSEAGVAMYPRGGGYSYTDAYLPTRSPGVCIDTQAMNNIVHVNEQDMYVTAEAGCTWEKLDSHLATLGLRTPFMGPQSGLNATLGGGVSQGSVSIGSGKYGPSGESVLSLDVVLADGTIIKTGSAAQGQRPPFFRHYGPDLTGLFCNDAGALGIKARVTLRLQKRKPMVHGLSFGFQSFEDMAKGMGAVARLNVATENMGLTHTALTNATTQGFSEDLRIFLQVARSGPDKIGSVMRAVRMAMHGRRYISKFHSSANFVIEGYNRAHATGQLRAVRSAMRGLGKEIPNTVPTVLRSNPFPAHPMLSRDGRRQLPMHGIFQYSRVAHFSNKYLKLLEDHEVKMSAYGVSQVAVYAGISTNGILFEPVLIWPDTVEEFHRRHTSDDILANVQATEANEPARSLVSDLHAKILDLMYECGGVHLQIGKAYPYLRDRDETQVQMLKNLKALTDPKDLFNPGALGLGG